MEELDQKIIIDIKNTLADSMSQVEQFVNWDLALNEAGGDDYYKACQAIVEPRFSNDDTSNEFSFLLECNIDMWKQFVINSAEGLVHKDNWVKLVDSFIEFGY